MSRHKFGDIWRNIKILLLLMLENILPPTPSIVMSFIVDPFEEYKSNFLRISSPISNLQIIFIAIQIDDVRSRTSVSTTY